MDADRRHEIPRSETKDFITQNHNRRVSAFLVLVPEAQVPIGKHKEDHLTAESCTQLNPEEP